MSPTDRSRRVVTVAVSLLCSLGLASPATAVPADPADITVPAGGAGTVATADAPDATAADNPVTDAIASLQAEDADGTDADGTGAAGTADLPAGSTGLPDAAGSAGSSGSSGSAGDLGSLGSSGSSSLPGTTPGIPDGVTVDHVEHVNDRLDNIFIRSVAMPDQLMKVNFLHAKDWASDPDATFPSVWMLGGLYGSEKTNGWLTSGTAASFFADKNVNVVMPVGGTASFYSDWQQPDRGETIRWETFLTAELPGILKEQFRTNDSRAVMGVSMGATASLILAGRHPGMFRFAGSFSGFQDMSSPGMPAAVDYMVQAYGRESATNMWGPFQSYGWLTHDPKLLLAGLYGTTVYLSAGTGTPRDGETYNDPDMDAINNQLEQLSRITTTVFAAQATAVGVDARLHLNGIGSHTWYSWVPELHTAWPDIAEALGV